MTNGWAFQYSSDGLTWTPLNYAEIDHILEALGSVGGQEEVVFTLPNTADNRTIIQAKPFIQVLFNDVVIYPLGGGKAIATGRQYSATIIRVTVYNYAYVQLKQASATVTQNYTAVTANSIATDICGLAGVSVGSVPSTLVSIKYDGANCLKAMQDLASACGEEYWADSAFNIGTRDSTSQTLGNIGTNTKRGFDYSKQVDQVIINGVDVNGNAIQGSAGSAGSIATFQERKVADATTLNLLAAYKLQTLNNPSNGNSLECLISDVYAWHPGQYISVSRADLELTGSFIIQRITKNATTCIVEVDSALYSQAVSLQETTDFAGPSGDLATYPVGSSQVIITSGQLPPLTGAGVMLQGLDAAKPSPGTAGRLYYATDTQNTYLDTGSAWVLTGTPLLGNMSGAVLLLKLRLTL